MGVDHHHERTDLASLQGVEDAEGALPLLQVQRTVDA